MKIRICLVCAIVLGLGSGCLRSGFGGAGASGGDDAIAPANETAPDDGVPSVDAPADRGEAKDTRKRDGAAGKCPAIPSTGLVALYRFQKIGPAGLLADAMGRNPARLVGSAAKLVSGPSGCGKALAFAGLDSDRGRPSTYGTIPHRSAWNLKLGAVELWVRFDRPAGQQQGILSRDAIDQKKPGHLSILRARDGRIVARLQRLQGETPQQYFLCSKIVTTGTWHHIRFDFGQPRAELYIDGKRARETTPVSLEMGGGFISYACGITGPDGIAGNHNPWVIGALNTISKDGRIDALHSALSGAIDHLVIRSVRGSSSP